MKHLMTLMALVVAVTAGAQGTTIHEYPWNPDSNNDNLIGVDDLLDFLPVFGDEFGNPPEPCDYDGSSLEELLFGAVDGSIVIDSIFIEFELEDIHSYYLTGCPNLITDTLIFANSFMTNTAYVSPNNALHSSTTDDYGNNGAFDFYWWNQTGTYWIVIDSFSLVQLGFISDGFFGGNSSGSNTNQVALPFPSDWYLDANGIHFDETWQTSDWAYYANYLHILPYWHYAE